MCLEVPDHHLAITSDRQEVLHGRILGILLAGTTAAPFNLRNKELFSMKLEGLQGRRHELDGHHGFPVGLIDHGHLPMHNLGVKLYSEKGKGIGIDI